MFDMQYNCPPLGKTKPGRDFAQLMLYVMFSWPAAIGLNFMHTGRVVRGTLLYTVAIAIFFKFLDKDGR